MIIIKDRFSILLVIAMLLCCIITITTISCKKENAEITNQEFRIIAWKYLNQAQQASVNTNWEQATIEKKLDKDRVLVIVTFGTNQDASLGPIQVFIDVKTKSVLGIGGRF